MHSTERKGLLYALLGFIVLSSGDGVIKAMAGDWAPTAMAALRYFLAAIGLSLILLIREGPRAFIVPNITIQIWRGVGASMAAVSFFTAVIYMPLAEVTTLVFVSPMIIALLAPITLGETVRRSSFISSGFAFVGVIIVLRPNFVTIGWAAALPLLAALGMSILVLANRAAAGRSSALAAQAYVAITATPILLITTLIGDFSAVPQFHVAAPSAWVLWGCAIVAITASTAHLLIYLGTTYSGAAAIAPMTYVQIIVAAIVGWVYFGEPVDWLTALGGAIIIGSGLYLWREGRIKDPIMTD